MALYGSDLILALIILGSLAVIGYLVAVTSGTKVKDDLILPRSITQAKWYKWVIDHNRSVMAWSAFTCVASVLFRVFSDRYFSVILTFSSMISMMSFLMVLYKIEVTKSVQGVSGRMIVCYVCILLSRLISIVKWEGYLPYDSTGDGMYQCIEFIQLCTAGTIAYNVFNRYSHTYNYQADSINPLFLIIPTFVLACIFHPNLNNHFIGDTTWAFALYLEAFASLPQLVLFHKEKQVAAFTSHFLAAQCLSKVCSFIFWFKTASELNQTDSHKLHGGWVIITQALQLLIMGDFIYQYVKCISKGVPVQFLITEKV